MTKSKKSESITIKIDEETKKILEDIVEKNDSTLSYEIRKMITYYLKTTEMLSE
jgi:predicted transcriptional regulator